ncbi:glycosyl hydrolase [uncultured Draconibacterium sp.]|uniref:glycosyl hydrolase n=1 Tax=uncultured Draconibacterium sp. TaxID=1573823 RepID=UPI0029C8DAF5|nr:glycosyl hydrolase [uncultured Draconibacterium sp.]
MMKRHRRLIVVTLFIALLSQACSEKTKVEQSQFDSVVAGFQTSSDNNTVWCYWYWINDDISKEGITKDLEAMKEAGIGAALIGNINPEGVDGKVPLFSDEWWECMVHAVTEGHRIGVDIGVFNCPGWSQSGGPWVKSQMAMRYLTFSETKITGPGKTKVQLVQPAEEFQDTHTLAFKLADSETAEMADLVNKIVARPALSEIPNIIDGSLQTSVEMNVKEMPEVEFEINFKKKITARQFTITPSDRVKCMCKLFAEVKGKTALISTFKFDRSNLAEKVGPIVLGKLAISLPDIVSDKFILKCSDFDGRQATVGFSEINISETPVIDHYIEKQLGKMYPTPTPDWYSYQWAAQDEIENNKLAINEVLDISENVDDEGRLDWDVPEGNWTVMRIGMAPTGAKNHPTAPQGLGYEVDKMSSALVQVHFDNFIGELLKRIPEESKPAFKYVIADSYEMGSQNWTDGFGAKFYEKYGYDPVKYLPVLSGRVVGSVDESERFLWDLRRAVADDVAYEYVGGLKKASNTHNLQIWLENYGHWGFPSEFMMYGGQSDLISGEFWNEGALGNIECKASSSTSHAYGKGRTSAEAFTAANKAYLRHPAELKKRGDWSFTEGINHFILHLYIHQPDDSRKPGMNAWFSTEFNRHNTWFGQANYYFDYLRRNQHLLQQGKYVADVCYFIGENAPVMTGVRTPEIPDGYSYDYINAEVILNRLSVKDGKFVLPDGMCYNVMVLPPLKTMRPEVLAKIQELVAEGGVVLGPKPEKSPSLQNYPGCDKELNGLAAKLWASYYTAGKMQNNYGQGKVFDGYSLEQVFKIVGIEKDVDCTDASVLWTHRTMPGMEIYFITNQSDDEVEINPSFRTEGLKPQLWDAMTGEIRQLQEYSVKNGRTRVPLKLEGKRSWYVVFTNAGNSVIQPAKQTNFSEAEVLATIDGPFDVDFLNKKIGPKEKQTFEVLKDWSVSEKEEIKYYSGRAVYETNFTINELPEGKDLFINLGEVAVMAELKINGKLAGGVWIHPYRLNISEFVKQGENKLEIEVVNLWRNRMIRDKGLSPDERYTWNVIDDIKVDEKPHSSGLLGPVQIECL